MLLPLAQKVTMDLVRNDPNAVALTQITHFAQLLLRPNPARGVMRIALDKKPDVLFSISQLLLHSFKSYCITLSCCMSGL
jgi:hypothetical protein